MKCFNCGYNQIEKSGQNCPICGVNLAVECLNCHTLNPKSAKFCLECGTSLERTSKRDRMFKAGVIFADVSGFTTLAETFEPEKTKDIINECFRRLTEPVYRYGGHIDKYIGDCVMAVFGMDSDVQDIPLKTIQCALDMREGIHQYHKQLVKEEFVDLDVSIGVTYGDVVLGNVGSKHDTDYTVIGDSVNVASRFQSIAQPGEIRVDTNIYNNTSEYVKYADKDFLALKNKENPVVSYLALSKLESITINYIDREVDEEIRRFIDSNNHQLQISGGAGVGKTTSVKRIIQQLPSTKKGVYVEVNKAMGSAFFGVAENVLNEFLGILSSDTNTERKNKLKNYLSIVFDDVDTTRMLHILSIILKAKIDESFESTIEAMDYHDLMGELRKQFTLFISQVTTITEVILVLDNVQYMDEQCKALFLSLESYCKCIFISRESLFELSHQLNVLPFTQLEMRKYKDSIVTFEMTEELESYIFELSKGYPRYLKALIQQLDLVNKEGDKSVLDISKKIRTLLPKIVDQFNVYRFNQLNDALNDILEMASAYTNVFSFHEIFILLERSYDKFSIEEVLEQNLVVETEYERINDETIYYYRFVEEDFKNAIYESLLDKRKKAIHTLIYNALIDRGTNDFEQIAYHANHADQFKLAGRYYYQAARYARKQFDLDKTEMFYDMFLELSSSSMTMNVMDGSIELIKVLIYKADFDKALDWIEKSKSYNDSDDYQSRLLLLQADIFKMMGRIGDILPIIELLENKLQKTSRNYGKLLQLKSSVYNMTGQPGVIEITEQSKALLLKSRDYESLIETLSEAGIRSFIEGNLQKGIEYLEQAMSYADQINNKASLLKVLGNLGIFYNQFGEREKSHIYFKNAMNLALEISNQRHYIATEINLAVSYLSIGTFGKASNLLEEAVELAKETNLTVQQCIALTNLGDVYYELGRYDEALNLYNASDQLALNMDMPIDHVINQIGTLKIWIKQKQMDNVISTSDEALKILEEAGELTYLSSLHYVLADFYIISEEFDKALKMAQKSKKFAEKSHDEIQKIRSMRKVIEIRVKQSSEDYMDLLDETIAFGNQKNLYYELAKLYVMLYINNPALIHYIYKAKEMALFFDQCQLTQAINKLVD